MNPMLNIAIRSARIAGDFIMKYYEYYNIKKEHKKIKNLSREIFYKAECLMSDIIHKSYPNHNIINTYCNNINIIYNEEIQWIINSIDSIENFIKNFPHFAVSIAIRIHSRTEVAVIYDPIRNELFTASRGQGAKLNLYRLRTGNERNLKESVISSYCFLKKKEDVKDYINIINKLFIQSVKLRITGSISLDMAYIAAGRIDGFFASGINHDICNFISGDLLVRESGGLVTDFVGGNDHFISGNIIAGNARLIKDILLTIRK